MVTLEINDSEINTALSRLARAVTDLTPVMQDIGEEMVASTRERFIAGVSPEGAAWAPKSQTTIDAYKRRGKKVDPRPLWGPSGDLSKLFSAHANPDVVIWGTNVIYAAVMLFGAAKGALGRTSRGGPVPWGSIPARPFLGVSDEDRIGILAALEDWLAQAWDPH